jgi:hypothetical protein
LTLADTWRAVGMSQEGFSNRRATDQMGIHHSVVDRLMQCLQATGMIDEPREDRLII